LLRHHAGQRAGQMLCACLLPVCMLLHMTCLVTQVTLCVTVLVLVKAELWVEKIRDAIEFEQQCKEMEVMQGQAWQRAASASVEMPPAVLRFLQLLLHKNKALAWGMWCDVVQRNKELHAVLKKMQNASLHRAWGSWVLNASRQAEERRVSKSDSNRGNEAPANSSREATARGWIRSGSSRRQMRGVTNTEKHLSSTTL